MNVLAAPADDEKTTIENSSAERFAPAKVIDTFAPLVKITVAVPLFHDGLVELLVQAPPTDQVSEPN